MLEFAIAPPIFCDALLAELQAVFGSRVLGVCLIGSGGAGPSFQVSEPFGPTDVDRALDICAEHRVRVLAGFYTIPILVPLAVLTTPVGYGYPISSIFPPIMGV